MPERYRTIVADPPWRYTQNPPPRTGGGVSAEHQYPTMTTEQIAALPVGDLAAENAHVYMWVTNPVMLGMRPTIMGHTPANDIVRGWGFEPKALITWMKINKAGEVNRGGMGWYFRGATEHIIFGVRGKSPIAAELRLPNVIVAAKARHSAKPERFFDVVQQVSPGPYLELFARTRRLGWDAWGNEIDSDVELAA